MGEDIFIKSVIFGGFNKEDVLKYIEKIQSDNIIEMEKIRQSNEQNDKQAVRQNEQYLQKINELEESLACEQRRFLSLIALNDEYCEKIYNLENTISELNNKFESIQDDCTRMKNVEAQIGSLLLDAVLYSDKMTQKAKQAATSITANAKQTIISTNDDVCRLSTDISQIAGNFSKDISELVSKIENLSVSLSSFACGLETENDAKTDQTNSEQETFTSFLSGYTNENSTPEPILDELVETQVKTDDVEPESDELQANEKTIDELFRNFSENEAVKEISEEFKPDED